MGEVQKLKTYALYRHYDKKDKLLYVGLTVNVARRTQAHKYSKKWFHDIARTAIEEFESKTDGLIAERDAILKEKPIHNICCPENPGNYINKNATTITNLSEAQYEWLAEQASKKAMSITAIVKMLVEDKIEKGRQGCD